jgi:asparagine synthase (glutamine-hydrolysing)
MSEGFFSIDRLQRLEIRRYCLPHLLRYEDRNSMAWSIEARVPFVTPPVVECALALPAEAKISDGFTKYALRLMAGDLLPAEVAWRRSKVGFEAPEKTWMRAHAGIARELVAGSALIRRLAEDKLPYDRVNPEMQWRLFNLAHWGDRFGVSL